MLEAEALKTILKPLTPRLERSHVHSELTPPFGSASGLRVAGKLTIPEAELQIKKSES